MLVRRFGSSGAPRSALEQRLLSRLSATASAERAAAAWEVAAWEIAVRDAPLLARAVHGLRGWDTCRAEQVYRWGARLVGLALPADGSGGPAARMVVREAGLFNLAVACFDTVVDDLPRQLPLLARSLHPRLLARRLDALPDSRLTTGTPQGPPEGITELFDASLESTGHRLRDRPEQRRHLVELLSRMYNSEIGLGSDPFPAKTLPVVYLGQLAGDANDTTPPRTAGVDVLFAELACFVAAWDDYQDIADDWTRGRANRYLRVDPTRAHAARVTSVIPGARRLLLARRSRAQVSDHLVHSLDRVLAAAVQVERSDQTQWLLARLIAGRP